MNYSKGFKNYRALRTLNGGGVREINFSNNATRSFILKLKNYFFQTGNLVLVIIVKFKIELGSFQGHLICEEFILGDYLK